MRFKLLVICKANEVDMWLKLNFFALILCTILSLSAANYKGYKIYDVIATNKEQLDFLHQLSENEGYDFFKLTKILNRNNRVLISPLQLKNFENNLQKYEINYELINDDVSKSIEQESNEIQKKSNLLNGHIDFDNYHGHDTINAYLDELGNKYKNRVFIKTVGLSFERRWMKTITITNGDQRSNKKLIFVDGGFHAREWISPAAALYIIHQLVENFDENKDLLENYDWIILPVVNPDGYEYTRISASNRLWRKTRKPNNGFGACHGVDPNRNFDFHWGENGTSSFSCMETYKGITPFSEPETSIVRDIMHSYPNRIKFYLTIHSYGEYLLYPWGWTSDLPETWKDLHEVAQAGGDAIKSATGTNYTVGSSTNVLYVAAGASDDYAFGVANIPISITIELPAGGTFGFDPPPSSINRLVTETWIGIRAMAEKVIEKY